MTFIADDNDMVALSTVGFHYGLHLSYMRAGGVTKLKSYIFKLFSCLRGNPVGPDDYSAFWNCITICQRIDPSLL